MIPSQETTHAIAGVRLALLNYDGSEFSLAATILQRHNPSNLIRRISRRSRRFDEHMIALLDGVGASRRKHQD